jgi:hypothetical protein
MQADGLFLGGNIPYQSDGSARWSIDDLSRSEDEYNNPGRGVRRDSSQPRLSRVARKLRTSKGVLPHVLGRR